MGPLQRAPASNDFRIGSDRYNTADLIDREEARQYLPKLSSLAKPHSWPVVTSTVKLYISMPVKTAIKNNENSDSKVLNCQKIPMSVPSLPMLIDLVTALRAALELR